MSQAISKEKIALGKNISNKIDNSSNQNMTSSHSQEHTNDILSYSGTSISSNNNNNMKNQEYETYKRFISNIELDYNLSHPKKRVQTIILHSNLDKSISMNDYSQNDIDLSQDFSGNTNDKLNLGFIMDNSQSITNNYKNNKRRTFNHLNRVKEEDIPFEEEKNNKSVESKKNKLNNNFNDNFDYNNRGNLRRNLGDIFDFKPTEENILNDKVFISQSSFIDNPNLLKNDNNYSNKDNKDSNLDNIKNLSTNIQTNSTKDILSYNDNMENNKKISTFNNSNSYQNLDDSSSFINQMKENEIKNNNNFNKNFSTQFTFMPEGKEYKNYEDNNQNYNFKKRNSLQNNYSYNEILSNSNNNKTNNSTNNYLNRKTFTMERQNNLNRENYPFNDNYKNNYHNQYDENEEYVNNIHNNNKIANSDINECAPKDKEISLTITDSDYNEENVKENRKKKNLLKSFFYGLLFGSTAGGVFLIKNKEQRKYIWDKLKNINFNSIINMLKSIFLHPFEFFKKIFDKDKIRSYKEVLCVLLNKFFDFFEGYNDCFRFIGFILSIYLIWLVIKSLIRASFKIWKYYN